MNKVGAIFGLVVIVLVVVGGWFWVANKDSDVDTNPAPVVTADPAAVVPGPPIGSAPVDPAAPVEKTTLAAIAPYTGSGSATRSFGNGVFRHSVATTLTTPPADKFYEGWLVMPTASGPEFFSTGKLIQLPGGFGLGYTSDQDYPEHVNVVITEETLADGLDNKPEAHVLEGSFE